MVKKLAEELHLTLSWQTVAAKVTELAEEEVVTSKLPGINGERAAAKRKQTIKSEMANREDIQKALKVKLEERISQKAYRKLAKAFPELPREYKVGSEYRAAVKEVTKEVPILPLDVAL